MGNYLQSKDVKIYPSAYRGRVGGSGSKYIDPESRLPTENNISGMIRAVCAFDSFVINPKDSYSVGDTISFVIHGYRFEVKLTSDILSNSQLGLYAHIRLASKNSTYIDGDVDDYPATSLVPFDTSTYTTGDLLDVTSGSTTNCVGLYFSTTPQPTPIGTYLLHLLEKTSTSGVFRVPYQSKLILKDTNIYSDKQAPTAFKYLNLRDELDNVIHGDSSNRLKPGFVLEEGYYKLVFGENYLNVDGIISTDTPNTGLHFEHSLPNSYIVNTVGDTTTLNLLGNINIGTSDTPIPSIYANNIVINRPYNPGQGATPYTCSLAIGTPQMTSANGLLSVYSGSHVVLQTSTPLQTNGTGTYLTIGDDLYGKINFSIDEIADTSGNSTSIQLFTKPSRGPGSINKMLEISSGNSTQASIYTEEQLFIGAYEGLTLNSYRNLTISAGEIIFKNQSFTGTYTTKFPSMLPGKTETILTDGEIYRNSNFFWNTRLWMDEFSTKLFTSSTSGAYCNFTESSTIKNYRGIRVILLRTSTVEETEEYYDFGILPLYNKDTVVDNKSRYIWSQAVPCCINQAYRLVSVVIQPEGTVPYKFKIKLFDVNSQSFITNVNSGIITLLLYKYI